MALALLLQGFVSQHALAQQVIADGTTQTASGTIDTGAQTAPAGFALYALNGGIIQGSTPLVLTTGGAGSNVLQAVSAGRITLDGGATIHSNGQAAYGAAAQSGGTIVLSGTNSITTATSTSAPTAIFADGVGSNVTSTGNLTIDAGIAASTGGPGVLASNGGTVSLQGVTIRTGNTGGTSQNNHALNSENVGSTLTVSDFAITTLGTNGYGTCACNGGQIVLQRGTVHTTGEWSFGLYASGAPTGGGQLIATDVSVATDAFSGHGAAAFGGGSLTLNGGTIATQGTRGMGLLAWGASQFSATGTTITTNGDLARGVVVLDGSVAELHNVTLRTTNTSADALSSYNNGANRPSSILVNGGSIAADQSPAIRVAGTSATITVNNGAEITSGIGRLMDVLTEGGAPGQLTFTADAAKLSGDIFVDTAEGSRADIVLRNNTLLTGAVVGASSMAISTGQWTVTGNSSVAGTLTNGGIIQFTPPGVPSASRSDPIAAGPAGNPSGFVIDAPNGLTDTAVAPALASSGFKTLTVANYVGAGGIIGLNTALGADSSASDRLVINGGTATGVTGLRVANAGGSGALTLGNGIQVVDAVNGGTTAAGAFVLNGRVVAGPYEYQLFRSSRDASNSQAWYLRSEQPILPPEPTTPTPPTTGPTPPTPIPPSSVPPSTPKPLYRPEVGAYLANQRQAAGMFVFSLHDRMGEPVWIDGRGDTQQDPRRSGWLRIANKQTKANSADGNFNVDTDSTLIQGGGDLARWGVGGSTGRLHVGGMLGYGSSSGDASSQFNPAQARGKVEGWNLGAYATWYQNDTNQLGWYVDGWGTYGWFKNKVQGDLLPEVKYDAKALTLSGETGYAMKVGASDWVVEPQAQLIYIRYDEDDITEPNGTHISGKDGSGWISRLGVRTYRTWVREDGRKLQPYLTLNWWHDSADNAETFNQVSFRTLYPSNRYEVKVGLNADLARGWTAWSNLGYQWGEQSYRSTLIRIGARYIW